VGPHGTLAPAGLDRGEPRFERGVHVARIVITDSDLGDVDIERGVFEGAGHVVSRGHCRTAADVIAAGAGADALLVQYVPITAAVMDALPTVRVIGRYGVSLDTIDLTAAAERGIRVINVPDYCIDEVADHTIALLLALTRGVVGLDREVRRGTWDARSAGGLRRARGMRLGLVGFGRIGAAVAHRARALGMEVVASDPVATGTDSVRMIEFDELLSTSDVISLHARLDPSTRHMIDARALARMRPGTVLVNTSRGGLIDQGALVEALRAGHLGGVALDVLEREPIALDDPLLSLPNVVVTPHAAFYSAAALAEMQRRVAEGIVAALAEGRG
jgi:D-3-phosphoglycerate dehydrogenase / 2-oxoglutarate reductase